MPEYRRPSLVTADMPEVSAHLEAKGWESSIRRDATAMLITISGTSGDLDAALVGFANTGRVPLPADLPQHVEHLRAFFVATAAQRAAMTQAQRDHVTEDILRILRVLVDDRLA